MGMSGIGIWQLLIVLAIVLLLFGSKRLGSLGGDLGKAISGFRREIKDDASEDEAGDAADAVEAAKIKMR